MNNLYLKCSSAIDQLLKAAGLINFSNDIAEKLSKDLPDFKIVTIEKDGQKFLATLVGSDNQDSEEKYKLRISIDPQKKNLKLDNFYIVDQDNRGNGIGKQGLSNIFSIAVSEPNISKLELKATLECGAVVWAKLGFLAHSGDFEKFQKLARQRLHKLQDDLPEDAKIPQNSFNIIDHILDSSRINDPRALWVLSDSQITVPYSYNEDREFIKKEKKLNSILCEWLEYRASLDFSNIAQMERFENNIARNGLRPKIAFLLDDIGQNKIETETLNAELAKKQQFIPTRGLHA